MPGFLLELGWIAPLQRVSDFGILTFAVAIFPGN